jgi:23S rRNA pseudouridine1911/1915/1917 synthase
MQIRQFRVRRDQAGQPLQRFIADQLGLSRGKAKALIDSRQVFVNDRRVWMARHALQAGDRIEAPHALEPSRTGPATEVLFEDADYVVANKPAGRVSNGPDSVEADLRQTLGLVTLAAVHRLDRDTSGCLLLSKRSDAFDGAVEEFRQHGILKLYQAIAVGRVAGPERTITAPVDDEPAVTQVLVIDSNAAASHLKLRIETGRTHQIRKHLQGIGHPVLGDRMYGLGRTASPEERRAERQMLHASTLQFTSPLSGKVVRVTAPLPKDFIACLRRLKLRT